MSDMRKLQLKNQARIILEDVYGVRVRFSTYLKLSLDQVQRIIAILAENEKPEPVVTAGRVVHLTGNDVRVQCCGMRYSSLPRGDAHTQDAGKVNCTEYKPTYLRGKL